MIQRSALPAVICADCGHPASEHRRDPASLETCNGGECPCPRTERVVNHAADVVLAAAKAERKRLGYALLVSTLAALLAGAGSLGISAWNTRQSERRDCDSLRADITAVESAGRLTQGGVAITQSRRVRYEQIGCIPPLPAPSYEIITPPPTQRPR